MGIDYNQIVAALRAIPDPQTGQDIIQARLVQDLSVEQDQIYFSLVLPSSYDAQKEALNLACQNAIHALYSNAQVHIHFKTAAQKLGPLPQVKNIIAVASGKGGVGKSTVSANLALALQKMGKKVGLLDADLYGPSIPTMFGLEGQKPASKILYGKRRMLPLEAYGIQLMSVGFIVPPEQAVVMRGPKLSGMITHFLKEVLWPDLDYLIVDLPPSTGDIQLTFAKTVSITGAIMVTTPQKVAVVDAVKAMNMFTNAALNVPILGVVENMAWFTPKEFPDYKYFLFGEGGGQQLAAMGKTVLLGQVPLIQGIREAGDVGKPALLQTDTLLQTPFMKVAAQLVQQLNYQAKEINQATKS